MIRIERHAESKGPFAEIVLDRASKRNAMTPGMLDQMLAAFEELSGDPGVLALVIRGEGRAFCAGFDLSLCLDDAEQLRLLLTGLSRVVRAMRRFARPVVVAAHGAATAGGCALVAAADLVVTDLRAKLGYPVVKLGISPAVNAPVLRLALRGQHWRERLLDPELISGEEARRIGLAHFCVDLPDDVVPRAQIEARKLAAKPPEAIARTKAWLNEIDGSLDDAELDRALEASLALVGTPEERELLRSLLA